MYKENEGALQIVIPIMHEKRMIGDLREVIFSSDEGSICRVSGLPETTGWLSKMRVDYSLLLENDCNRADSLCSAQLINTREKVQVNIEELTVTLGKTCTT